MDTSDGEKTSRVIKLDECKDCGEPFPEDEDGGELGVCNDCFGKRLKKEKEKEIKDKGGDAGGSDR